MDMYFEREPQSLSDPQTMQYTFEGTTLTFLTDHGVFSRGEMDPGSALLLTSLPPLQGEILDLGCGWGALGVTVARCHPNAHVTCVDVNLRALDLCRKNAAVNQVQLRVLESDGLQALPGETFDAVITNPPIRAGKEKMYALLQEAAQVLREGGRLFLVIRKQQGGDSCIKFLKTMFASVEKIGRSGGYWILEAGAYQGRTDKS